MDKATITRSKHFDYSSDDPDSYGGEPALGAFINRINNIASIVMLSWLLKDSEEKTKLAGILDLEYNKYGLQYIRLGGPYEMDSSQTITAKHPWAVEWYRVQRNPDCPICSDHDENQKELFPELQSELEE